MSPPSLPSGEYAPDEGSALGESAGECCGDRLRMFGDAGEYCGDVGEAYVGEAGLAYDGLAGLNVGLVGLAYDGLAGL